MELREYWSILRRRWWLPVVLAALVGLLSLFQLRPWQPAAPSYNASMRMLVGVLPAAEQDVTAYDPRYYAWLTSEYLVDDFTEVVRSTLFAQQVSQRLADQGLTIPAGLIQGSSATGKVHRILSLSITWPDRAQLEVITTAAVTELRENTAFYFRQLGTENALVTILDEPQITAIGPSLRQQVEFPLRLLLTFLAGVLLVFLLDYFDTALHNRQEVEALGLVVIGEIPRHRRRK